MCVLRRAVCIEACADAACVSVSVSVSVSLCVCSPCSRVFSLRAFCRLARASSCQLAQCRSSSTQWNPCCGPSCRCRWSSDGGDNITGACNIGSYACCRYGGSRWGRIECWGIIHSAAEHNALAGARTQAPFTLCTEGEELTIEQSQILGLLKYKTATFKPELHCKWWGGEFKIY